MQNCIVDVHPPSHDCFNGPLLLNTLKLLPSQLFSYCLCQTVAQWAIESQDFKLKLELHLSVFSILYDIELELELEHRHCLRRSLSLHDRRYTSKQIYIFLLYINMYMILRNPTIKESFYNIKTSFQTTCLVSYF